MNNQEYVQWAWEYLKHNGVDADVMGIMQNTIDELYHSLRESVVDITEAYRRIEEKAQADFISIKKADQTREQFIELASKTTYPELMVIMLDNDKDKFKEIIFDMCKPEDL